MHQQNGMTFLGMMLMVAGIVFIAIIGMKLVPAYIEYFSVKKAITKIASDPGFDQMSRSDIAASFNRNAVIDNITIIKGSDLEVSKTATGETIVGVDYQTIVPLVGNVSALLDFSVSTDAAANLADE